MPDNFLIVNDEHFRDEYRMRDGAGAALNGV
jgi:hypothetical protein